MSLQEKNHAKRAQLHYRIVRRQAGRALLEVEPHPGYKHQIRAQLAAVGCPVAGDFKYDRRQKPASPQPLFGGRAISGLQARAG